MVNLELVSSSSLCPTGSNQTCQYLGKTVYLYLKIIERMIEGCPFLYQDKGGAVYHVAEKGVEVVESWKSKEPIVAFVDGDGGKVPDDTISRYSVQLIVASSPKDAYLK